MNKNSKSILEMNPIIREDLERIVMTKLPWEMLRNKTALVTGGGGFLAAYLIKSLMAISRTHHLNIKVICVVRSMRSAKNRLADYLNDPDLSVVMHDISQPLPNDFPCADFIIHSASQASPKYYGVDPVGTLMANSTGTMYMLEHAVRSQAERFLFFSSGEVYGNPVNPEKQVNEQDFGYIDPINVRSCYAESKRIGETMCAAWTQQYSLHTSVVRPFHTYGPGMDLNDGRVFADFVANVVAGRDIIVQSDGSAIRPFCYIADATIGFLTILLLGDKANAYNVGNPDCEISIKDLANLIARLFPEKNTKVHFKLPLESDTYLKSSIKKSIPAIDKIVSLGWAPYTNLQNGFWRSIKSFQ